MTKVSMRYGVAVVTGAAGGVGKAVARMLGRSQRLVLTDILPDRLEQAVNEMRDEGFEAVGLPADLSDRDAICQLVELCMHEGALRTIVNTAGLSPAMADWRSILRANIIGPEVFLQAFEPLLQPGSVGVMIASTAGHLGPDDAAGAELLVDPLQPDLLDRMEPVLKDILARFGGTIEGQAYSLSKRAIIRMCERRAEPWAEYGARIVSVSPGGIWTPMGRKEANEGKRVTAMIAASPMARWGSAMDMATAVQFLTSEEASYITGCDLRVDGGAVAKLRGANW